MRFLFAICCILAVAMAESSEKYKKTIRPLAESCKESVEAMDDDIETIVNLGDDFSNKAKCLTACVMEQLGLVSEGKFTEREKHMQAYKEVFSDDAKRLGKAAEVVDTCIDEAKAKFSGQKCLMEHHAIVCMLRVTS